MKGATPMPQVISGQIYVNKIKPIIFVLEKQISMEKQSFFQDLLKMLISKYEKMNAIDVDYKFYFLSPAIDCEAYSDHLLYACDVEENNQIDTWIKRNRISIDHIVDDLSGCLSRRKLLASDAGFLVPNIYLFVDGNSKYYASQNVIDDISNSKWLKISRKRVISLGVPDQTTIDTLSKFCGSSNNIMIVEKIDEVQKMKKIILEALIEDITPIAGLISECEDNTFLEHVKNIEDIVHVDPIVSYEDDDCWTGDDSWN